jgi:hypothetical protein
VLAQLVRAQRDRRTPQKDLVDGQPIIFDRNANLEATLRTVGV